MSKRSRNGLKSRPHALRRDDGSTYTHRERPSRQLSRPRVVTESFGAAETVDRWENCTYYGVVRRFSSGFPLGGGPYAVISISAIDETARHDWRDYQQIKNALVGEAWEAVELYPAESRLRDPSNRFYLWCTPPGVFCFGLPDGRLVLDASEAPAPQRPFPK